MYDSWILLVVTAASLAYGYRAWAWSSDAREAANRVARETCSKAVVQLLDDTVAFAGFRWRSDRQGRRELLRTYTFDYTRDGISRAQGFIVLKGEHLKAVGLAD